MTELKLKRDTEIYMATLERYEQIQLEVINNWPFENAPVFVASLDAYGQPGYVITASCFEDAYEALLDELPPIDEDEVCEAYGFNSQEELNAAINNGEYPELIEGYAHQPNASDIGIVDVGHYLSLREWTRDCGVRLHIGAIK